VESTEEEEELDEKVTVYVQCRPRTNNTPESVK
jgi:hypothetical protein